MRKVGKRDKLRFRTDGADVDGLGFGAIFLLKFLCDGKDFVHGQNPCHNLDFGTLIFLAAH